MTFLSNLFGNSAKEITTSVGDIIDSITATDPEKLEAKAKISEIVLLALNKLYNAQRDVLIAEMQGNFLQKSWRPLTMLTFVCLLVLRWTGLSEPNIPLELETPNHSGRFAGDLPDTVVIHYTAGASLKSSASWLTDHRSNASAHLVIGKSGEMIQLAPFNIRTWHAGKSYWKGRNNLNNYSIGIELDNAGIYLSPTRKRDPGPAFPMQDLKSHFGLE